MLTFLIILGILIGFFVFHFISLAFVRFYKKKTGIYELFAFGNLSVSLPGYPNIMLSSHHYSEYMVNEEDYPAHAVVFEYGGYCIRFTYGHKGKAHPALEFDIDDTNYYGLYSIDGELFWRNIWIGKKLYDNPFALNHFCGAYVFDMSRNKLINKNDIKDDTDMPYWLIMKQTHYINQKDEIQSVNCIKWYICERSWTTPFLHWLHLDELYKLYHIDLEFESDTELGIKAGSWKGGVMGASIPIHQDPELRKLYIDATTRNPSLIPKLDKALMKRISEFMTSDKKY